MTRTGGIAALLVLLRWRRPEALLIAGLSLVPQTASWYEVLRLFLVPRTLREAMFLSASTSIGYVLQDHILTAQTELEFNAQVGALMVAFAYLPATLMVLRRANEGRGVDLLPRINRS